MGNKIRIPNNMKVTLRLDEFVYNHLYDEYKKKHPDEFMSRDKIKQLIKNNFFKIRIKGVFDEILK